MSTGSGDPLVDRAVDIVLCCMVLGMFVAGAVEIGWINATIAAVAMGISINLYFRLVRKVYCGWFDGWATGVGGWLKWVVYPAFAGAVWWGFIGTGWLYIHALKWVVSDDNNGFIIVVIIGVIAFYSWLGHAEQIEAEQAARLKVLREDQFKAMMKEYDRVTNNTTIHINMP